MRNGFVLHHNGPPAGVIGHRSGHVRCEAYWRAVRSFHVSTQGWSDIAYSFGVCPHGQVFGLADGWTRRQFANGLDVVGSNDGPDRDWYTILGFFGVGEVPPAAMTDAARELIHQGRITGRCGLSVLPHNAFKRKACPGPEWTHLAAEWNGRPFTAPSPVPAPTVPLPSFEEDPMWFVLHDLAPATEPTANYHWLVDPANRTARVLKDPTAWIGPFEKKSVPYAGRVLADLRYEVVTP